MTDRLVIWEGIDARRWEVARVDLAPQGVRADGTQVGIDPVPYRLDYRLDATSGFVTRELEVRVTGEGWSRRLHLEHDGRGIWHARVTAAGITPRSLGPPGAGTAGLSEARDCDLGLSPLTNLLPVRRLDVLTGPGQAEIVTAWVAVPDLVLRPYRQRYEHVAVTARGAVVRFVDLGLSPGFTAELELDSDGLVEVYPRLARRVTSPRRDVSSL
jgi:hypothetical protein